MVPCDDLDAWIGTLTGAGFSLLAIGPADEPRWALMGHGRTRDATLRLDAAAHRAGRRHPFLELDGDPPPVGGDGETIADFMVTARAVTDNDPDPGGSFPDPSPPPAPADASSATEWIVGRAGMRYRDLLPGRWGGEFIASHIHIPTGGPVPDYVHYHHIDFQLIFCKRGWVRVVYQDQGEPFVLHAGDAILQAPGIRHRVLESSDDFHVVEVSSPAEHATFVEHDLELPNGENPGQWYGGQRYVHHRATDSPWVQAAPGVRSQSMALGEATSGRFTASVTELDHDGDTVVTLPIATNTDFQLVTVLDGGLQIVDSRTDESVELEEGTAVALDDRCSWTGHPLTTTRLLTVSRHRV